jgi:pimeloyl-ACP methyl ester carboxylesterase
MDIIWLMSAVARGFRMDRTGVVYVHGLWLNGQESIVLRRRLAKSLGCTVYVFRYHTVTAPMEDVVAALATFVRGVEASRLHFIGHSLGGLVIHRLFERHPQERAGRVVFLGTPGVASRAAAGAARMRWAAPLIGRCLAEELATLRERRWSAPHELGIIAGTRPVGLGQFVARFHEASDGTVAVSETRLAGATDHITLPVSHMGMLLSSRVAQEAGGFLERGRFSLA